jgi:predicted phosphodiesterase
MAKYKVVALGDVHSPWNSKEAMSFIFDNIQKIKPDIICQLGDILDLVSFSTFPKKPLHKMSARDELTEGIAIAGEMWDVLRKKCPKAKMIQILGNHCVRLNKRILEKMPELHGLVDVGNLLSFPGVETVKDYSDFIVIDNVAYHHGWKSKPMEHARQFEMSAVFGHTHRAWIQWEPINGKLCFDMSVGYLADPQNNALQYRETKIHKWVHGIGVIDKGIPSYIPINIAKYQYKPRVF